MCKLLCGLSPCGPQLTAVDGRRALVILPNDPDLVDILAANNVDISVSEGEQQGNLVSLLGNLIFPLLAFGGLFYLFQRAGNNGQVRAALWSSHAGTARSCSACAEATCCSPTSRLQQACRSPSSTDRCRADREARAAASTPWAGMGGQMDFMKNKAKFQEDPDTGVTFDDVAVRLTCMRSSTCPLVQTTADITSSACRVWTVPSWSCRRSSTS